MLADTDQAEPALGPDERKRRPRIAITLGDPNGIGPEVVLQCLADPRLMRFMEPVVIGSIDVLKTHAEKLGYTDLHLVAVDDPKRSIADGIPVFDVAAGIDTRVQFGKVTEQGGRLAMRAVEEATDLCIGGTTHAMVTAPISKEAISLAGYKVPGHTEFIARRAGSAEYTMMMVAGDLRIGLVTAHIPIWNVPRAVTVDVIRERIRIINNSLIQDFGIARPRIAVLGLNPHAGDGGVLGREENETIIPAIKAANDEGYLVQGPFAADGFFAVGAYRTYDAVLAMYHDQGLIPFKTLAFDSGVNFTAGLSVVRTSPDHGTAYDIAGEGRASVGSMRSAAFLAVDIARRRATLATERRPA